MFTANLLPGQGFQSFTVYKKASTVSKTGRPTQSGNEIEETEIQFLGALIKANQKEAEQWKQNGHPITHVINEFSAQAKAKATDYLVTEDGRQFYVQGTKNPGDLNLTMIYYIEERFDVRKKRLRRD